MVCLSVRLCVHTITMATVPTIYVRLLQYVVTVQCKILKQENVDELYMTIVRSRSPGDRLFFNNFR